MMSLNTLIITGFVRYEKRLVKIFRQHENINHQMEEYAEETNQDVNSIDFINEWNEKENQIKKDSVEDMNISSTDIDNMVNIAIDIIE